MLTGHFVGRDGELRVLEQMLAELGGGQPAALELRGEPGIGKTRLLSEFAGRADQRGALVLTGSASDLERDVPFSVFVDALDEYLQGLEPRRLSLLSQEILAELVHVFPSLSASPGPAQVALQHERYRTHRAVRALLEALATDRPLVLVLDDLHWADSASIELLSALLRRPPAAPVLITAALRPRQTAERLSVALERAHRAAASTRVELRALTFDESRAMLGDAVDYATAADLYGESGGVPFYLEQLARLLDHDRPAVPAVDTWVSDVGVPLTVAASLREELALLSAGARGLLEGASVAGDPFELELAAAAAQTTEAAAIDAVDDLLQFGLVRTTDAPRRFRFRHPLVRRAVYETTAAGWRLGAHQRCADLLASQGASAARRALHVERSARGGDMDGVAVLRQAGDETLRLAPATAARWFAAALRLLPDTGRERDRVELLRSQSGALTAVGRLEEAHSLLVDAIAATTVPSFDPELRASLVCACAGIESALGWHDRAHIRLVEALGELADPDSSQGVATMIALAMNGFWLARYGPMREMAGRAVRAARLLADPPLTAAALAVQAAADSMAGAAEVAEASRSEAAAMVASLSDAQLARRLDAATWLAGAELYLDRYAEADAHAVRALELARSTGQGELFLVLVQTLGRVWFVRGKLAEAAELLDGGIESARLGGNRQALVWSLFNRSVVSLATGDTDGALAAARESVDLCRDLGPGFHRAWAAVRLAAALLETGQPANAIELLLDGAGGEEQERIPGSWRAYSLETLTRCRLELGLCEEATRSAAMAATWASTVELPLATAWAARAAAAVDLGAGDHARAAERALASAVTADGAGAPIEAALARILAGRALAAADRIDQAVAELRSAAAVLEVCGAHRYRAQAEQELRKLGVRIHRRSMPGSGQAGIASLTDRELEVARLVTDRKTNTEIAAELFVSKKTVETHLRNIFHKINVSSRVDLARAVERSERVGTS